MERDASADVRILGALGSLSPVVNFADYSRWKDAFRWGPRTIPDYQLVFVASGRMDLRIGGEIHSLQSGDCAFYGPDLPHELVSFPDAAFYSIHFSWSGELTAPVHPGPGLRECAQSDIASPRIVYSVSPDDRSILAIPVAFRATPLESLFLPLVTEYREQEPGFELQLRAGLSALLVAIFRLLLDREKLPERGGIAPALEAIAGTPGRSWTVAELAKLCGYHPTYFADVFRERTGQAPKTYLINARIRKAKQLLLTGTKPTDVASLLGYGSIHYFSRNFKEMTGVTPSEFRMYENSAE